MVIYQNQKMVNWIHWLKIVSLNRWMLNNIQFSIVSKSKIQFNMRYSIVFIYCSTIQRKSTFWFNWITIFLRINCHELSIQDSSIIEGLITALYYITFHFISLVISSLLCCYCVCVLCNWKYRDLWWSNLLDVKLWKWHDCFGLRYRIGCRKHQASVHASKMFFLRTLFKATNKVQCKGCGATYMRKHTPN